MKRLKKIMKWMAIGVATLIAILLVLNAYFVWSTGTELEHRLRELRESGNPVQISDFAREPIPPEQNAATYLRRAGDDLDAIHKELAALYPKTAQPPEVVTTSERDKLDKLFAAYPRLMPLLEQAAACPDYDPQLDCTLPTTRFMEAVMNSTAKHRQLYRVLRARTTLLIAKGQRDEAVANQVLLLRLTRHWRREPLLIGYLVTVACEQVAMAAVNQVLQAGSISPSMRTSLDAELARLDSMEGYIGAMRNERAYSLASVREFPMTGYWLLRGFTNDLQLRIIDLFDGFIKQAAKPFAEVWGDKTLPGVRRSGLNPYAPLVTLLAPALTSPREAVERVKAMSRCLRVLNAIQTHVEPGSDRVPQLADLGLPPEVTIDPYNSQPLHIKKLPEGWLVYSVGMNLVDDGGTLEKVTDVGVGPITAKETAKKP
ncbi:MAG: hypothetical protein ACP5XB_02535 [Isosphaeraceae bacterium]